MVILQKDLKVNCFKCNKDFVLKYNYPKKRHVLMNNWGFWTEKEENSEKYICDKCLVNLYLKNKIEYWKEVKNPKRRETMSSYIYKIKKSH